MTEKAEKSPTGNVFADNFLEGGIEKGKINMFYGEAATGKTTLCMMFAAEMAAKGKRVLFLDSENGFSTERIAQIRKDDITILLENIIVVKIKDFEDQNMKIRMLKMMAEKGKFDAIIFDTIGNHYRKALKDAPYKVNKETDAQFSILKELAEEGVFIMTTNQVYADFREKNKVEIVGGEMFKNWSGVLVELRKENSNIRNMVMTKPKQKEEKFKIEENGFIPL